jgi:hypothetical protein
VSGEPAITVSEALARGEGRPRVGEAELRAAAGDAPAAFELRTAEVGDVPALEALQGEGLPGVDDDELRAALQEVTACAQPDPDAYSLPDRIEPGQTLVSPQGETLRVSRGGTHVYGVWTTPPVSFDAHHDVAALRAAGWTLREFAPIDTEEARGRAKDAARLALDGTDPVTRRALLGDLCIEAGGDPYAVRRALGAPIPGEILGELVAVPLRAFHAALDVLGDLLDTELEHEVCPLCMAAAGCSHVTGCPVGCAETVRNALDYGDPIRQRAALVRLGALRGDEEASAPQAPVSPEPDGALRIHDVESFVQALGDAIEEGALPNVLGLDDLRQLSSEGARVVSLCFTDDSPPVQIALSLRAASPSLPGEHAFPHQIGEMDPVPGLVAADGRVLLPAYLGLKPGDAVRFERVGDGFRLVLVGPHDNGHAKEGAPR